MPESTAKKVARARVRYLGEPRPAARAGVPRDNTLGIDTCTTGQQRLRALIALGLFNRDYLQPDHAPAAWGLHTLVAYDIFPSPRYDRLVLITDVPHNVAPYLLPSRSGGTSLPGLRLEQFLGERTYVARHLPTGAELVITGNPSGTWGGKQRRLPRGDSFYAVDKSLTSQERDRLDRLPVMSHDVMQLLAGLTCRIAARDPNNTWALGNWFSDPLRRPGWLRYEGDDRYEKALTGVGSHWTLRWNGFPYADDVAASLTEPPLGIPDATVLESGGNPQVRLGKATLSLYGQRVGPMARGARS